MSKIQDYFKIEELVCPHVYDKFGLYAWRFFDPRLLDVLLAIRENIAKPIYVNNWDMGGNFTQRGFRCNICPLVKEKTSLEKLYVTAHSQGMGVDFDVKGMSPEEVRKWIKDNQILLPHPIRLEEDVNWLHLDTRSDGFRAITWFKG
jgi:hypothetical protein